MGGGGERRVERGKTPLFSTLELNFSANPMC